MPLSTQQTFEVTLRSCECDPPAKRPVFIMRYLSSGDELRMTQINEAMNNLDLKADGAMEEYRSKLVEMLTLLMVGWRNVVRPDGKRAQFSRDSVMDCLTNSEIDELTAAGWKRQVPSREEKKTSGSQPRGGTGRSKKSRRSKNR
jgi:hypothetical protein